jgi:hypothetical protein
MILVEAIMVVLGEMSISWRGFYVVTNYNEKNKRD